MCIVNFELRFEKSYLWFESILLVVNCDMWAYILWFEYMVFDLWLVNLRLVEFYPWIYNFPKNQESDFSFLSNSNSGNPRKDGDNIEDLLASIFGTNLAKQFFGNYHFFDFFWTDDTILRVNQVNQLCHYNKWWIWKSKKQFGGKFLLTSLRRRPADSNSWIWIVELVNCGIVELVNCGIVEFINYGICYLRDCGIGELWDCGIVGFHLWDEELVNWGCEVGKLWNVIRLQNCGIGIVTLVDWERLKIVELMNCERQHFQQLQMLQTCSSSSY